MEAGSQRLWGPDVNVSQITKLQITITLQSRGEMENYYLIYEIVIDDG